MPETPTRYWPRGLELTILALALLACLLPFVNRAYHIDDTLFVWAGQQILKHPYEFYGFDVNWYRTWEPMAGVTQNPPATCYFLALVGSLFGWEEVGLHLAMVLPAWGLIWGTYRLAERFNVRPLPAAFLTLLTPATLICGTSVMCDVMMLCFWVWTIETWDRGLRERNLGLLLVTGGLIALTTVTKYFGVSLIPLLGVYSFAVDRAGWRRWLLALVFAVALLAIYQAVFFHLYGKGGLIGAAGYATGYRGGASGGRLFKVFEGLGFIGGCVGIAALPAIFLVPRASRLVVASVVVAAAVLAMYLPTVTTDEFGISINDSPFVDGGSVGPGSPVFWQFLLWVAAGTGVLLLSIDDLRTHRDPIGLLLFLWVFGTTVFAIYVNWVINGRTILPLVPAVALILVRRLDREPHSPLIMPTILATAAVLALTVTAADVSLANANRAAARRLVAEYKSPEGRPLWFVGHWGFQYYAQAAGARPWDYYSASGKTGDYLIQPFNNCLTVSPAEKGFGEEIANSTVIASPWVATNVPFSGAGYYACNYEWRPLPFTFTDVRPEQFFVYRLTKDQTPDVPKRRGG
jgi:Dolichyl-phosphate-mannose-protein mannosyltransferase